MTKKKNNSFQFIIISIITFLIVIMFILAIRHFTKLDTNTYSLNASSITYDNENNYISTSNNATLKMGLDGNYKLINIEDMLKVSYNLGTNAIISENNSSNLKLYGIFYEVLANGEINRLSKENKISIIDGSRFFKIADRKYLLVDKKISSSDGSINTKDYLIVEIDRNGNSTIYNDTINVKEINPLVINTTSYDFDIANEYLDINNTVIDLKKIIGSTNNYQQKTLDTEEKPEIDNSTINSTTDYLKKQTENLRKQVEAQNDYYNKYFKTVVNSFNNLNSSLQDTNKQQYNMQVDQNTMKGNIKNYNLSRWLTLGIIEAGVSTIKINYNVFDPNNEYTTIYLEVTGGNLAEPLRVYLNKENNNTTVRDLNANTNYNISLKYTTLVDGESTTVTEDVIDVRTKAPTTQLRITKVTPTEIGYYLQLDNEYRFDKATLNLYSDNNNLVTEEVDITKAVDGYEGFLKVNNLGYKNELKLENIYYNNNLINLDIYAKFVNADD